MPYTWIRESNTVPCDLTECSNNDCGSCTAEVNSEDITPSEIVCTHYCALRCDLLLCINNDGDGYCEINDNTAVGNSKLCPSFNYSLDNEQSFSFKSKKEMENFICDYDDISLITYDKNILRFLYCKNVCNNKLYHAFIQISEEDQKNYTYRPKTGGTILMTPIDQMTLDL